MLVRVIKPCFINGALRHPGQTINLKEGQKPNPKCMIEVSPADGLKVEADPMPKEISGKTRKDLMIELDAAGISYSPRDRKEDLEALLNQVIAAKATGGTIIPERIPEAQDEDSVI